MQAVSSSPSSQRHAVGSQHFNFFPEPCSMSSTISPFSRAMLYVVKNFPSKRDALDGQYFPFFNSNALCGQQFPFFPMPCCRWSMFVLFSRAMLYVVNISPFSRAMLYAVNSSTSSQRHAVECQHLRFFPQPCSMLSTFPLLLDLQCGDRFLCNTK